MAKGFDFNQVNSYLKFMLYSGDFEGTLLDDAPVDIPEMRMANFKESILEYAGMLAATEESFSCEDYGRLEAGPDDKLYLNLYDGRGNEAGTVFIEASVINGHGDELLPDGRKVSDMASYTWKDFGNLEKLAQEQEAGSDFTKAVEDIPEEAGAIVK